MSTTQNETWTVLKVLTWTKNYLVEKGIENSRLEAEWLLAAALGLDRVGLYVNHDKPLSPEELASVRGVVSRRARREPLQYILGSQEFMGLEFLVTPAVLIPRHDTETLVGAALRVQPEARSVLDIGTGSGCIAVALAKALPGAVVVGVDRSSEALAVAAKNVDRHQVRVELLQGSLFEPVGARTFDLVVSNPPYIPSGELASLQPEVKDFEPSGALDGGSDGLDYYRRIIAEVTPRLSPGGWLVLEVGLGQAEAVRNFFTTTGRFTDLVTVTDPGGIERVVGGRHTAEAEVKHWTN